MSYAKPKSVLILIMANVYQESRTNNQQLQKWPWISTVTQFGRKKHDYNLLTQWHKTRKKGWKRLGIACFYCCGEDRKFGSQLDWFRGTSGSPWNSARFRGSVLRFLTKNLWKSCSQRCTRRATRYYNKGCPYWSWRGAARNVQFSAISDDLRGITSP